MLHSHATARKGGVLTSTAFLTYSGLMGGTGSTPRLRPGAVKLAELVALSQNLICTHGVLIRGSISKENGIISRVHASSLSAGFSAHVVNETHKCMNAVRAESLVVETHLR